MEYRQLPQEEYADLSSRILYEDNHLLVVDKKAGEITQGESRQETSPCRKNTKP